MGQVSTVNYNTAGIVPMLISLPASPAPVNVSDYFIVALTDGVISNIKKVAGIPFNAYIISATWDGTPGEIVGNKFVSTDDSGYATFFLAISQPGSVTIGFGGLGQVSGASIVYT